MKPINTSKERTPIAENAKYCSLKMKTQEEIQNISLHCLSTDKCTRHYKKEEENYWWHDKTFSMQDSSHAHAQGIPIVSPFLLA